MKHITNAVQLMLRLGMRGAIPPLPISPHDIGKGKVVPVLPLTEHHNMNAYWGVEL
jgi:hypothetical protein